MKKWLFLSALLILAAGCVSSAGVTIPMKDYSSRDYRIFLTYPEKWALSTSDDSMFQWIIFSSDPEYTDLSRPPTAGEGMFMVFRGTQEDFSGESEDRKKLSHLELLSSVFSSDSFNFNPESTVVIDGYEGTECLFSDKDNPELQIQASVIEANSRYYIFVGVFSKQDNETDYKAIFNAIQKSISFSGWDQS